MLIVVKNMFLFYYIKLSARTTTLRIVAMFLIIDIEMAFLSTSLFLDELRSYQISYV